MSRGPASLPEPRTPSSRTAPIARWGVLGTGWIAERFIASLRRHSRQEVVALASRDGAARARGVFCMEALWSLFLPRYDVLRQLIAEDAVGPVRTVLAEYGEAFGPEHRILRPDLAGGPLLDLGTYPVALSTWLLGAPDTVNAAAIDHPAGVHGQVAALLGYRNAQAVVHTTLFSATPTAATIAGEKASVHLPGPAYQPGDVVLIGADGRVTASWTESPVGHGALHHQAAHVARCLDEGVTESPLRPLADSLTTLRALDAIRESAGISFAGARSTG